MRGVPDPRSARRRFAALADALIASSPLGRSRFTARVALGRSSSRAPGQGRCHEGLELHGAAQRLEVGVSARLRSTRGVGADRRAQGLERRGWVPGPRVGRRQAIEDALVPGMDLRARLRNLMACAKSSRLCRSIAWLSRSSKVLGRPRAFQALSQSSVAARPLDEIPLVGVGSPGASSNRSLARSKSFRPRALTPCSKRSRACW